LQKLKVLSHKNQSELPGRILALISGLVAVQMRANGWKLQIAASRGVCLSFYT